MNNNDERDYAEETAARAAYEDECRAEAEDEAEQHSLREKFWHAVAEANQLEAEAGRLCDEANDEGTTNNELDVRHQADDKRAEALALAVQLIPR